MSIYLGTTKVEKLPNGSTPLFFATAGEQLIYPHALFRANPGETTTYLMKGANQQIALQYSRTNLLTETELYTLPINLTNIDGWSCIKNLGSAMLYGAWRYRTELKLSFANEVNAKIGYARIESDGTSTFMTGTTIAINNEWHAYDFTTGCAFGAGKTYVPAINGATGYLIERNAVVTFLAD